MFSELTYSYGRVRALTTASGSVPTVGRTLLLGENGAGKSTLLKVLSGATRPSSGRISIGGRSLDERRRRQLVALMPQQIVPVPGLTVLEQVTYASWVGGCSSAEAARRASEATGQVAMDELAGRPATQLSGGQLRRLGVAEALARPGQMVLLDEPTAGLDPKQRARFRTLISELTVPCLLSTHQVDDASDMYEHVIVLHQGTVAYQGEMVDFLRRGAGPRPAESAFLSTIGDSR
ncbi:ATP-binding cassette domain-containing protein [Janibacter alkaliphilus]